MSKMKEHYQDQIEAMNNAPMADDECLCIGPINSLEEVCDPCKQEYEQIVVAQDEPLPDNVINMMADQLQNLDGKEFWTKMDEIEEYWEDNYLEVA